MVLATLLDDVDRRLKPRVQAIINLRNAGARIPDGGLFTAQLLKGRDADADPPLGQLANRGAVEMKAASGEALADEASEEVDHCMERHGWAQ
jgi:hypothetical protein